MKRPAKDRAAWGLVLMTLALLGTAVVGSVPPETMVVTGSLVAMLALTWLMVFWLGGIGQRTPGRLRGPKCTRCSTPQEPGIAFCLRCGEPRPAPMPAEAPGAASTVERGRGRAPSGR